MVLERRLDAASRAPVAVAFSGGGDSLALLLAAQAYAGRCGRPLVALHLDHGLQAASAAWAEDAERTAGRLGAAFVGLAWTGDKPGRGLPAAARAARHRLIAEAARQLGAPVVLVGHTLDDQLENVLMRGAGVRVGLLREWLAAEGLGWLDDPANADLRHPRVRARRALAEGVLAEGAASLMLDEARSDAFAGLWRAEPWGGAVLDRQGLSRAEPGQAARLLQIAAVCVSGAERLSRPARAEGLLARLKAGERFVATLGGARIEARTGEVVLEREAGEAARGGLEPLVLEVGTPQVWDGRFEVGADLPGLAVEALRGQGSKLGRDDRARVASIPAAARPALPLWRKLDDSGAAPRLALAAPHPHLQCNGVRCRALCEERLAAASGAVTREEMIGTKPHMAHLPLPSYVEAGSKD